MHDRSRYSCPGQPRHFPSSHLSRRGSGPARCGSLRYQARRQADQRTWRSLRRLQGSDAPRRSSAADRPRGVGSARMASLETDVLVIGGGATGAGVAWDAALRGFDVILVDRADLAEGTSGRFHGLLHSGGRYVVKDRDRGRGVRGRERDPAPDRPRLHRGHRRHVRRHARRRPGVRRRLPEGLSRRRAAGRGDRGRRGAAARAATEPRHQARVHGAGRVDRRLEDRVVARARRQGARRAHPHVPPRDRPARRRRRGDRRAAAQRAHRRGARRGGRLHFERVRRVGGADREDGRDRGRRRDPRQGDHDRHEPPAREHGHQPLHAAGRRRHPRPDPHRQRDRHDRPARRRSRRHPADPGGGRRDARRRRAARAGFRDARAMRVWAGARPLFQDEKASAASPSTRATSAARTRCRPRRARRHRAAADDVRRQAHDAADDGAGPRRRDVPRSSATNGRARPRRRSRPATRTASTTRSVRACARARRRCRTSS